MKNGPAPEISSLRTLNSSDIPEAEPRLKGDTDARSLMRVQLVACAPVREYPRFSLQEKDRKYDRHARGGCSMTAEGTEYENGASGKGEIATKVTGSCAHGQTVMQGISPFDERAGVAE
jgi:hypothetical protein